MYAAPGLSADREEYLLGKTLDNKLLENDKEEEEKASKIITRVIVII